MLLALFAIVTAVIAADPYPPITISVYGCDPTHIARQYGVSCTLSADEHPGLQDYADTAHCETFPSMANPPGDRPEECSPPASSLVHSAIVTITMNVAESLSIGLVKFATEREDHQHDQAMVSACCGRPGDLFAHDDERQVCTIHVKEWPGTDSVTWFLGSGFRASDASLDGFSQEAFDLSCTEPTFS